MSARDVAGLTIAITLATYAAVGATVRIVAEVRRRRIRRAVEESFRIYQAGRRQSYLINEDGDPT